MDLSKYEVWFVTGSQPLYGKDVLGQVAVHSKKITKYFSKNEAIPVNIKYKSVVTTTENIEKVCRDANQKDNCIGLIVWMHTFSPAKRWIAGLKALQKPMVHLHTQFNKKIPWAKIDMDFMNLNQSAHGGREFGYMASRMNMNRKVIVGHWQEQKVINKLVTWIRAACAWQDAQNLKIARFGDNMRNVAVTEGDKVGAEMKFGYSVNGYGLGDLVEYVNQVIESEINQLLQKYEEKYNLVKSLETEGENRESLYEAAKMELGMSNFLEDNNLKAFTTTFENLHGLKQLPGLAVQRLMKAGYGFGAEGDWKTAALVRAMKVMGCGLKGGTSFMEDYTYHLEENNNRVLGAHMLEVCESIAEETPSLEIHPLDIGGKADPVRLVFNTAPGSALNASIVDMGGRFRMIVNTVEAVRADEQLPELPVARVLWEPKPDLNTSATAWILAGGAHHTSFSQVITVEHLQDFAEMADVELLLIDNNTDIGKFKKELKLNKIYYNN